MVFVTHAIFLIAVCLTGVLSAHINDAEEARAFANIVDTCAVSAKGHQNLCAFWLCVAMKTRRPDSQAAAVAACEIAPSDHASNSSLADGNDQLLKEFIPNDGLPSGSKLQGHTVDSPCYHGPPKSWSTADKQHWLLETAMQVYQQRANETYTQDMKKRWIGINNRICPPSVPRTSDCSSCVTWIYWTLFGNGTDFLNGEKWTAGYTGSLAAHGVLVSPANPTNLAIGDLCFYYTPMSHVAIYVGNGKVVSHGSDPVGYYPYNYAHLDYCRRYL